MQAIVGATGAVLAAGIGAIALVVANSDDNNNNEPTVTPVATVEQNAQEESSAAPTTSDPTSNGSTTTSSDFCVVDIRTFDGAPQRKYTPVSNDPSCRHIEVSVLAADVNWSTEILRCNINQHHDEVEVLVVKDGTSYPMPSSHPGVERSPTEQAFEEVWIRVSSDFTGGQGFLGACKTSSSDLNFKWIPALSD